MNKNLRLFLIVATLCVTTGCDKYDWTEEESEATQEETQVIVPSSLGYGTQIAPYTVGQVLNGGLKSSQAWFIGYVVGSTYSTMNNAIFEAETNYTSNILISDSPECTSTEQCVPVELKSAKLQQEFSLHYNSSHFRQCIMVRGRYNKYFRVNGIRDLQAAYYLPGFDISTIKPTPTEWEEWVDTY